MSAEKSISITDRMNLVYQDADIIPLFIQVCSVAIGRKGAHFLRHMRSQENYLNMRPNTARSDHHRMARMPCSHVCPFGNYRTLTVLVTGAAGGRGC